MNPFEWLESSIYILSTALFYPVLAGLVLLVAWLAAASGRFARELLARRGDPELATRSWAGRMRHRAGEVQGEGGGGGHPPLEVALESILNEAEDALTRPLDRLRFAVRVGPSLGLMGTLIPMATALASLAGGDLASLARNMVTAFATTVVGLAVGTGAYALAIVRGRWLTRDLDELRLTAEELHSAVAPRKDLVARGPAAPPRVAEPLRDHGRPAPSSTSLASGRNDAIPAS